MEDYILELNNVSFKYENNPNIEEPQLKNINLKIRKGEYVGVIGGNNSGKSTLCSLCNGLIPKSIDGDFTGNVMVEGQDIADISTAKIAKMVGLVLPDPEAQLSQITVYDELCFGPANLMMAKEDVIRQADKILKMMNLENMATRSPFSLSGGEQQRVAIASVLAMEPEILVLDEPTSNLDPTGTEDIFKLVGQLNKEMGMTVLLVEHEIELMAQYVDRFIVMDKGEIILDGTPREVFANKEVFDRTGIFAPSVTDIASKMDEKKAWSKKYEYPITLDEMITIIDKRKDK